MDKQKKLTKEVPLLIYGGGEVGNSCYGRLKGAGYNVFAALDGNKCGEHIIEGLFTYKLGAEPEEWDKENFIVIICLANGMIHKDVAENLNKAGYLYIVFLPMNHCISDSMKRKLTKIYNEVLFAESSMQGRKIISYEKYSGLNTDSIMGIICKTEQNITVWMGLELLFSESLELWKGDKSKIFLKPRFKDKNIACAHPYENLFDYFAMKTNSYEAYFDSKKVQKSQKEKELEIEEREKLYRLFKREHGRGMDFFIEAAPEVVWNPKNYCNLVGGHNRTLYLLHEGHSLFPVKMQVDDFEKWYNKEIYEKLVYYIRKDQVKSFYAPLPHPCFLNFPVQWEDTGRTKLAAVLNFFSKCDLTDMTVLDCSDDEGYFARNMERIGAKEVHFINSDMHQVELAHLFNQLLYRDRVVVKFCGRGEIYQSRKFDIVFVLKDKCNSDIYELESKANLINEFCGSYLVMETTSTEQIEYICRHTDMKDYLCIHKEYKSGQIWELGVYSRRSE